MELSDREQELYDLIKSKDGVTIKQIQEELSLQHVGAMGRLIGQGKVRKEKRKGTSEYKTLRKGTRRYRT